MQRALPATDDNAAQAGLIQRQAAQQTGQSAADNRAVKFHPDAPVAVRTGRGRPSG